MPHGACSPPVESHKHHVVEQSGMVAAAPILRSCGVVEQSIMRMKLPRQCGPSVIPSVDKKGLGKERVDSVT